MKKDERRLEAYITICKQLQGREKTPNEILSLINPLLTKKYTKVGMVNILKSMTEEGFLNEVFHKSKLSKYTVSSLGKDFIKEVYSQ